MRTPRTTSRFERDVKLMERRGEDIRKLRNLMLKIATGEALLPRHKDHPLKGEWIGSRDVHVAPDWILIYRFEGEDLVYFERTGTHSDLFDE